MIQTDTCVERMPISDAILQGIYHSDQSMYPAPLTYKQLQSWVRACPQSCLAYAMSRDGQPSSHMETVGAVIFLPVKQAYWKQLIVGKVKETEIDASAMLSTASGYKIGLHCFHIEKFENWGGQSRKSLFHSM
ncbi:hypothetical protein P152DRAFT_462593 [Eremomyces bilateralis CBS 781.70]|uniref:Uncharacterized protein n=1 Tax=Eremomyces bilateralis CBS 781.70 TaxID=1392243 RepID=A0A6G1FRP2_9PEZI|nr:uncharacterized protein P152DRAFT_462593 [Eremomyces bilateralis CBS 781.70]KAF1808447.1 hypothetical protein P152DRAFT_462593 [Eremomyces bilateralis CBS 781.70]